MAKDENMDYDKMIDSFVIKCKNNNCDTSKKVFKLVYDYLKPIYKNRAPLWKIKIGAEDITQSICIKMGIDN